MSDHHGTDTPYEDLLDRAVSAIRDTDLGHQGWALNQPRTNKQLNEQAKEFLKELFAKGEDDRDPIQKEKSFAWVLAQKIARNCIFTL